MYRKESETERKRVSVDLPRGGIKFTATHEAASSRFIKLSPYRADLGVVLEYYSAKSMRSRKSIVDGMHFTAYESVRIISCVCVCGIGIM